MMALVKHAKMLSENLFQIASLGLLLVLDIAVGKGCHPPMCTMSFTVPLHVSVLLHYDSIKSSVSVGEIG